MDPLAQTLLRQSGVVSRTQLLDLGMRSHEIRRLLRRRELVRGARGIYVDHTGEPLWIQRAWTAVLAVWPAALCHGSALRADDGPDRRGVEDVIHVAIDRNRSPAPPPGVRLHRVADLDTRVRWNLSPPRVRVEHAVLDLAAEAGDDHAAIARLADAVQARRTTAGRLREVLAARGRVPRRAFLDGVLDDVTMGTCSVLEHGYLTRVERPHGLPAAGRQVQDSLRGTVYRDVEYRALGLVVELDGRLFHDTATARDADLERDLDLAVDGRDTVRLGWGQVFGRPCSTADRLGRLLRARGWPGAPRACPTCRSTTMRYAGATG